MWIWRTPFNPLARHRTQKHAILPTSNLILHFKHAHQGLGSIIAPTTDTVQLLSQPQEMRQNTTRRQRAPMLFIQAMLTAMGLGARTKTPYGSHALLQVAWRGWPSTVVPTQSPAPAWGHQHRHRHQLHHQGFITGTTTIVVRQPLITDTHI